MSLDAELGLDGIPALDLWDLIVAVLGNTTPGLFTQSEDIDIDFRVSGLPHAVVKQAENFRVCETREEDRESSSSTSSSSRLATE